MAKKILVIDDEPDLLEILGYILKSSNYSISSSSDSLGGIKKAKQERPDLILLDIMMPDMDGFAILTELRKDKDTKNVPIIMLTAKSDSLSIIKAFQLGASDYIIKPFDVPTLTTKLNKFLKK